LLILKLAGNARRAERSTSHPAQAWPDKCVEVWTVNPPGYGGSPGRASLDHVKPMAAAVWRHVQQARPHLPVLLFGNSIGSLTALHAAVLAGGTAAAAQLRGLLLRNPPALIPLIRQHYARWYHGGAPNWLLGAWNRDWDACRLAAECRCPLLLLQSQWDRVVPPRFQDLIFEAHPGPKHRFVLPRADHDEVPVPEHGPLYTEYLVAIRRQFSL
jgi:pimeloyl-ACP methyl ester carboxylesterase